MQGAARAAYEKKATLLLAGVPAPRRSRVRAAAAAAVPLPRTAGPVLSDYSLVVRWLPRPHLLPINGLCIARFCFSGTRFFFSAHGFLTVCRIARRARARGVCQKPGAALGRT
jgi:hypothetical protein